MPDEVLGPDPDDHEADEEEVAASGLSPSALIPKIALHAPRSASGAKGATTRSEPTGPLEQLGPVRAIAGDSGVWTPS
jgi:hypothetical protein